ncbi:MAG: hypothetical protein ACRCX2_34250 [Paraclostridium sp.]
MYNPNEQILTRNRSSIELCYLAEDSKPITASSFKVYIPRLMPLVNNDGSDKGSMKIDKSICMNENNFFGSNIEVSNVVHAKSIHGYRYLHNGRIPKTTISKLDGAEITLEKGDTGKPFPKQPVGISSIKVDEVGTHDFIELNPITINRGHKMYGFYVGGTDNEFVIAFIDGVVPYKD